MIEIPPKFAGRPPVNPEVRSRNELVDQDWSGARGIAEDVRYYGQWMWDEAKKRIGHLYPPVEVTAEMARERPDLKPYVGQKLTVIAWIWARTVRSPNPAFRHVDVPLASTFILSSKVGKEAYVEPVIEGNSYRFTVRTGKPPADAKEGTKLSRGSFRCVLSNTPFSYAYIDDEANAGRMGARLMAVVLEGQGGRAYITPTEDMEATARSAEPTFKPDTPSRGTWASNAQGRIYGFRAFGDYFTPRQLVALTTFSDLVTEAGKQILQDAGAAGLPDDQKGLDAGGRGARAYAEAVGVYLAFAINKLADRGSTICGWDSSRDSIRNTFGRQAIPMTWDYAESNLFSESSGSYINAIDQEVRVIVKYLPANRDGFSLQGDARRRTESELERRHDKSADGQGCGERPHHETVDTPRQFIEAPIHAFILF